MKNRLSSLSLQGFKTFATTETFEFPGQITAIVGPNGSGKSNIADSIRWVLGEQSYSLLRAKKTDDMIFSGSQQKPRAGMAQATITFNNEDGWLPIDYSAISITRRAYRDGQNDYLLNGQKVRLRDITELLSQTGLAEMTYTIIGQGLVDVALALKPDERRKLFEEAAGIGLYRSRKEDAQRRLENTRKNLDRVLDILTEVKPRLRSLEKQVKRLKEYQHLRDDLQIMLRDWYGYHWHQKQQDVRNIHNAYLDQEVRLGNLREKHAIIVAKVSEHHLALQEERQQLEKAHNTLSAYHQQLEKATRNLAILDERIRSLQQQKNNLDVDIGHVQEELTELSKQETQHQSDLEKMRQEFQTASNEKNAIEIKLEDVTKAKQTLESVLAETRQKKVSLETEKIQIEARIVEISNRLHDSEDERIKLQDALTQLAQEKTGLENESDQVLAGRLNCEKILEGVLDELGKRKEDLQQLLIHQSDLLEEIGKVETVIARKNAELEVLDQAEAALSGYSEGSKKIVEKSKRGILPDGIEPLAKNLIVDQKYEKALGAALGELAEILIIPDTKKTQILTHLEANGDDRVALITLNTSNPQHSQVLGVSKDGLIGFANELVRTSPDFQEIVDHLLSDIVIVKDRRTAERLQPDLAPHLSIVTLNGLVFRPNGVMISGQNAASKRIGRTRQRVKLHEEIRMLQDQLKEKQEEQKEGQKKQYHIEKEVKNLTERLEAAQENLRDANSAVQENKDSIRRVEEQLAWHQERLEANQSRIEGIQQQIDRDHRRIEAIDVDIDMLLEEEEQQQATVKKFPVFELQQSLNHWQTHFLVAQNSLRTAQQRFNDYQAQIVNTRSRLETFQERMRILQQTLKDNQLQLEEINHQIENLNGKISATQRDRIQPLSELSSEMDRTYQAQQKMEEHSHQQIVVAERHHTQLQMELGRQRDQLKNLQEKIEDDFGLVSFDYDQRIDGPTPLPFDDGLIENLPRVQNLPDDLEDDIKRLKTQIRRIGAINPEAENEYKDVKERFDFMTAQIEDLEKASHDLNSVIEELDLLMERDFVKTFKAVNQEFSNYFSRLFNGGEASLSFLDAENPVEGGVDIEARLPGRRTQNLALLSGGERSLAAVALIFALLKISPTPFCILDEVDAMLDESNVGRFIDLLNELSEKTQFILITHNRNTVQAADVIYGITMSRDSTSQIISLRLEDVDETYIE